MHHSTNCLYLYLCRPRQRLSRSVCTTADIVLYHRLPIPLYTIPQTFYTSVHHTTNCLYFCAPLQQTAYTSVHRTTDCLYLCTPHDRLFISLCTIQQTVYTSVHRLSVNTSISTPCNRLSIIYLPVCDKKRGEQGDKRVKRAGGGGGGRGGRRGRGPWTGRGVLVAAGRRMGEVYE